VTDAFAGVTAAFAGVTGDRRSRPSSLDRSSVGPGFSPATRRD